MTIYNCEKCGMEFKQKSHFNQHLKRKNPCVNENKMKEIIDKAVTEKITEIMNNTITTATLATNTTPTTPLTNTIIPQSSNNTLENNQCTFIEVCAGAGGLSSGLIKAGFTPLLLNDNNKDCCDTLKRNHPDTNIICSPMEKLDLTPYIDKVDLLTGGIPCQSYSQSGLRKGLEDPRGELIYTFIDMIHLIKPKLFMIENVKGLITHDSGETIKKIIQLLNREQLYDIEYKLLNSAEYGVPQKRERVFIVGKRKHLNIQFQYPEKNNSIKTLQDVLVDVPVSPCAKYTEEKINLFKLIPQGGCWVNLPEDLQKSYLGNSYFSGGGKRGILHRLSMAKPSLTLLCTPSQKQTERCHPIENRPLSIREYARIQTFDDDFQFVGSLSSQYKQIGNAVPVELARQVGLEIKKALVRLA